MALEVVDDWVAVRLASMILDSSDLDDLLRGQLDEDLTLCLDMAENSTVLELDETPKAEDQSLTKQLNLWCG